MARFFNKNNAEQYYQNMPPLQAIKLNEDGTAQVLDNVPAMRPVTLRDKIANSLLGVQATPTDGVSNLSTGLVKANDEETGEEVTYNPNSSVTASSNPRVGGLLNDLASGYNENYNNRFSFNNIGDNDIDFDRKKGFGYRLGEGLGTVGRFIDSPLGRFGLAYGLNSALGYKNSLQEGLTAAVGRQNAQTADRVYRQQLRQMGYTDDDLNQINGNITNDIYKNLSQNVWRFRNLDQNTYVKMKTLYDRQLQQGIISPEEYKYNVEALNNQYVNSQIQTMQAGNVEESNQTKLLPYKQKALELAPQISLGNLGVAQGNLALNTKRLAHQIEQDNKPDVKLSASQKDAQSTLSQIGTIRNLIKQNPNATGLQKGYVPGDIINRVDKNRDNIKTRTAIDALRTKVRHDLTGAQFSPKEAKEYERFLPTNKDNAEIINAKLDALEQRYYADFGVSLTGDTGSTKVGKYNVRVK